MEKYVSNIKQALTDISEKGNAPTIILMTIK
jgi:hypothetical protein